MELAGLVAWLLVALVAGSLLGQVARAGSYSLAVGLASALVAGSAAWLLGLGSLLASAAVTFVSGVLLCRASLVNVARSGTGEQVIEGTATPTPDRRG